VGEFLDPIARIRMGAGTMAREDPAQVEHLLARSPRPPDRRLVGVGGAMTEMPPAGDGNFDERLAAGDEQEEMSLVAAALEARAADAAVAPAQGPLTGGGAERAEQAHLQVAGPAAAQDGRDAMACERLLSVRRVQLDVVGAVARSRKDQEFAAAVAVDIEVERTAQGAPLALRRGARGETPADGRGVGAPRQPGARTVGVGVVQRAGDPAVEGEIRRKGQGEIEFRRGRRLEDGPGLAGLGAGRGEKEEKTRSPSSPAGLLPSGPPAISHPPIAHWLL